MRRSKLFNAIAGVGLACTFMLSNIGCQSVPKAVPVVNKTGDYNIYFLSKHLEAPFNPVHNCLHFDGPDADYFMHGVPIDRKTGGVPHIGNRSDTLRAGMFGKSYLNHRPTVARVLLFSGTQEEWNRKLMIAADTANSINQGNHNYLLLFKNSNSVARTLVESMGLSYPGDIDFWAPGEHLVMARVNSIYENPVVVVTPEMIAELDTVIGEVQIGQQATQNDTQPSKFVERRRSVGIRSHGLRRTVRTFRGTPAEYQPLVVDVPKQDAAPVVQLAEAGAEP